MKRLSVIVVSVFVVALAVRLSVLAVMLPQLKPDQNPDYYRELGRNILAGKGFVAAAPDGRELPNINRPPGYPLFLAGLMAVTGDRLGVLLAANCVLAALACGVTVVLAARWLPWRGAAIAGLIAALDPNSVLRCCLVMTEMLFTLLVLAGVCVLVWRREKTWAWGLVGVLWGLAALCRAIAVMLPLVAVAAALLWRVRWRTVGLLLVGFAPLIGLWMARNAAVTGQWFYSSSGQWFLVSGWAANEEARQTGVPVEVVQERLLARMGTMEFFGGPEQYAHMQRARREVVGATVRAAPWRLACNLARGVGQTLLGPGRRNLEKFVREPRPARGWWPPVYTGLLAVLLLAAAWGAVWSWRQTGLLVVLAAYFVLLSATPLGNSRFRYPAVPMLAVLAVAGVEKLRRQK